MLAVSKPVIDLESLRNGWARRLVTLENVPRMTKRHADAIRRVWLDILTLAALPADWTPPGADWDIDEDDGLALLMYWERPRHSFQLRIFEDGSFSWFGYDMKENIYDGSNGERIRELPARAIPFLQRAVTDR